MNLSRPKGTRDFVPGTMAVRTEVIRKIEDNFIKFGFKRWDGPTFENLSTLTLKSGDAIVGEIYNFKDKADRELGLRFELTASLARIIASNGDLKLPVKAYNYGSVFRYENPQSGRYREFMQMDVDIFGSVGCDAELELFLLAKAIFDDLYINNFKIAINDKSVIKNMLLACDIAEIDQTAVCRIIDKVQKIGTDNTKKELSEIINNAQIKSVEQILNINGSNAEKICSMQKFLLSKNMDAFCLDNLNKIVGEVGELCPDINIEIDFSLMRGLGYYTGTIFEMQMDNQFGIGSVAGGGRYDMLISAFGGKETPACGFSFGIERIMDLVEKNESLKQKLLPDVADVFVANVDEKSKTICKKVTLLLRNANIKAEYEITNKNYKKQLSYAIENNFKYLISIGEDEMQSNKINIKNLQTREQITLPLEKLTSFFK